MCGDLWRFIHREKIFLDGRMEFFTLFISLSFLINCGHLFKKRDCICKAITTSQCSWHAPWIEKQTGSLDNICIGCGGSREFYSPGTGFGVRRVFCLVNRLSNEGVSNTICSSSKKNNNNQGCTYLRVNPIDYNRTYLWGGKHRLGLQVSCWKQGRVKQFPLAPKWETRELNMAHFGT